jgi:glycosyltransferase involved in cell wall biosynthesis
VVVPPGIALAAPPPQADARATFNVPVDAPVVAFVGRLTRVKRPDRLIATAQRVVARVPDAVFLVAGDGDLLEATRDQAQPLGDAVRFLGIRSDVEAVLAAADVVLLTSDNEGMPVSLIEAAMAGRPSVTTAVGSAGEVVIDGETGLVIDGDADALADATLGLLQDPDLCRRMGNAARTYGARSFSRARLVADTERLYDTVLGARGATG